MHRYTIFYVNNLQDWTLQYPILCHIYSYQWFMNETKNILYHNCFDNRDSLLGDDDADDDDDNDTGDMSTCDMEATDDEVVEIFRKQVTW